MEVFFNRLRKLYQKMDEEYNRCATLHEFECFACKDNCCLSLFFHHTHIEKYYFLEAVNSLEKEILDKMKFMAAENIKIRSKKIDAKIFCPANFDARCIVYEARPMICRLHGIPYKLVNPVSNKVLEGKGCSSFYEFSKNKDEIFLDRSHIYKELMVLEKEFREKNLLSGRMKQSIAEFFLNN